MTVRYHLLSFHEKAQLRSIAMDSYRNGAPYWWGKNTMPKLADKGLVEPHPEHPKAWRITAAGLECVGDRVPG